MRYRDAPIKVWTGTHELDLPEPFFLNLGPGLDFFMTQPVTRLAICLDRNRMRFGS